MDQTDHTVSPRQQVDQARRSLTKAGLASPIVLATLASHNALAGGSTTVPNKCTISGKLSSGSQPGSKYQTCTLGYNCSQWKSYSWPIHKGNCYGSWCGDNSKYSRGSCLSNCSGNTYIQGLCRQKQSDGSWKVCPPNTPSTWNSPCVEMTMYETLCLTGYEPCINGLSLNSSGYSYEYFQEACTAFLNSYQFGTGFPIDTSTCKDMFSSTRTGGYWQPPNQTTAWSQHDVCDYWACLHSAG